MNRHGYVLMLINTCLSIKPVHRGLLWDHYGYQDNENEDVVPIIDSAYVLLDFVDPSAPQNPTRKHATSQMTLGCLELCMYAEGSRHQEEIVVTGMKGRIEGTLVSSIVCKFITPTHFH